MKIKIFITKTETINKIPLQHHYPNYNTDYSMASINHSKTKYTKISKFQMFSLLLSLTLSISLYFIYISSSDWHNNKKKLYLHNGKINKKDNYELHVGKNQKNKNQQDAGERINSDAGLLKTLRTLT